MLELESERVRCTALGPLWRKTAAAVLGFAPSLGLAICLTLKSGSRLSSFKEVNFMTMNIGEIAALAGVPTATVRYYERRGIIAKPPRTNSGYRKYGTDTAKRLRFIKRAQELGFSLDDIRELLELRVDDPAACPIVETKTREKIAQVARMIRELTRMQDVLGGLADSCRTHLPTAECPILEALAEEGAHA